MRWNILVKTHQHPIYFQTFTVRLCCQKLSSVRSEISWESVKNELFNYMLYTDRTVWRAKYFQTKRQQKKHYRYNFTHRNDTTLAPLTVPYAMSISAFSWVWLLTDGSAGTKPTVSSNDNSANLSRTSSSQSCASDNASDCIVSSAGWIFTGPSDWYLDDRFPENSIHMKTSESAVRYWMMTVCIVRILWVTSRMALQQKQIQHKFLTTTWVHNDCRSLNITTTKMALKLCWWNRLKVAGFTSTKFSYVEPG